MMLKDRHYTLVIVDSSGHQTRRVGVSRRSVYTVAGLVLLALLIGCGMLTDSIVRRGVAAQAETLQHSNVQLRGLLAELQQELPAARQQEQRAKLTFAQVWAKSGLGLEPRTVGVGPVDAVSDVGNVTADKYSGRILRDDPDALPLELERIGGDSRALQQSLGELLAYFHDAGRLLRNTPSIRPTNSPWITSPFGKRRDPIFGTWMMHEGLDLGGHIGQKIFAPADGVVIFAGRRGGYGRAVVIDHGYGIQTHFGHLSKFLCHVGEHVKRGEVIAEMGTTGKSTGPHLHYEVRRMGEPLDPQRFILD